jgi:hypothetical protein
VFGGVAGAVEVGYSRKCIGLWGGAWA